MVESLTADEAMRIRIALIFGDPGLENMPDSKLEEAKRNGVRDELSH